MTYNANVSHFVFDVTDTGGMFACVSSFNGGISGRSILGVIYMGGMLDDASSFNSDVSDWDVSNVLFMFNMFCDAASPEQNLGKLYAALDCAEIDRSEVPCAAWEISAQNSRVVVVDDDDDGPMYGVGDGCDKGFFETVNVGRPSMDSAATNSACNVSATASNRGVFEKNSVDLRSGCDGKDFPCFKAGGILTGDPPAFGRRSKNERCTQVNQVWDDVENADPGHEACVNYKTFALVARHSGRSKHLALDLGLIGKDKSKSEEFAGIFKDVWHVPFCTVRCLPAPVMTCVDRGATNTLDACGKPPLSAQGNVECRT